MSVADALMLMLVFGGFILSLIALIVTIVVAILDSKKEGLHFLVLRNNQH
ncbi:putative holin-like toxin [Lacticaseibacillus paracasei]